MGYATQARHPLHAAPAVAGVALFHLALIYALTTGLGRNIIDRPPVATEARVIEPERIVPPPPPLTPVVVPLQAVSTVTKLPQIEIDSDAPPVAPRAPSVSTGRDLPAAPNTAPVAAPDVQFSGAAIIRGARAPAYPDAYQDTGRPGKVLVDCLIAIDGAPSACAVISADGGNAFAAETLRWLTGPNHPVFRAARRGGKAVAEHHRWEISFETP